MMPLSTISHAYTKHNLDVKNQIESHDTRKEITENSYKVNVKTQVLS